MHIDPDGNTGDSASGPEPGIKGEPEFIYIGQKMIGTGVFGSVRLDNILQDPSGNLLFYQGMPVTADYQALNAAEKIVAGWNEGFALKVRSAFNGLEAYVHSNKIGSKALEDIGRVGFQYLGRFAEVFVDIFGNNIDTSKEYVAKSAAVPLTQLQKSIHYVDGIAYLNWRPDNLVQIIHADMPSPGGDENPTPAPIPPTGPAPGGIIANYSFI